MTRLGDDPTVAPHPINQEKLMAVLQEGLGEVLSYEEVEALAQPFEENRPSGARPGASSSHSEDAVNPIGLKSSL